LADGKNELVADSCAVSADIYSDCVIFSNAVNHTDDGTME